MSSKKKAIAICLSILATLTIIITLLIWPYLSFESNANREQFKATWTDRFRQCHTLHDVKGLPQPKAGSLDFRVFPNGSWVAISWHCFHDEEYAIGKYGTLSGEWDGGVLRDSTGQMYWTPHHFCGYEGFTAEFLHVPAKSLAQFYQDASFKRIPVS